MSPRHPLAPALDLDDVGSAGPARFVTTLRRTLSCTALATAALVWWPATGLADTVTFDTVGQHSWTVPARVFSATFDLYGGQGGDGFRGSGGLGGRATVTLAVTPGQVYQLNVGGAAGANGAGGANGGAQGGGASGNGGGGGGATDARTGAFSLTERFLVAGGGGGGGNYESGGTISHGGGGGGTVGAAGTLQGGQGGTQNAGGAGAGGGADGAFAIGGAGACSPGLECVGGGGGGWYGGGGGGGGGSGHGPEGVAFQTGARAGNGLAIISYFPTPTPPTVVTGPASGVTTTEAVLTGSVNPNGTPTTYHFDYGTSTSYGSSTAESSASSDSSTHDQQRAISGLAPNTTYHFRIVASNSSGTSIGSDVAFTTTGPEPSPPSPQDPAPTVSPSPEDAAPTVSFTAPSAGLALSTTTPTVLSASATDDLGVGRVDFLDDDRVVCSDLTVPYTCDYRPRGEDVGRNTLLVIAYDTAGQTATAVRTVTVPRFDPIGLTTETTPTRRGRSTLRFVTAGVLALPAGVTKAAGCKGWVTVLIKDGSATVSSRRAKVGATCRYRSVATVHRTQRLRHRRLGVVSRFRGNAVLSPKTAEFGSVPVIV